MFAKVSSQKLRELERELAIIGDEEPDSAFNTYPLFARSLAVLMRTELSDRRRQDPDPCREPIPGFPPKDES
jgi:hypothetical protein